MLLLRHKSLTAADFRIGCRLGILSALEHIAMIIKGRIQAIFRAIPDALVINQSKCSFYRLFRYLPVADLRVLCPILVGISYFGPGSRMVAEPCKGFGNRAEGISGRTICIMRRFTGSGCIIIVGLLLRIYTLRQRAIRRIEICPGERGFRNRRILFRLFVLCISNGSDGLLGRTVHSLQVIVSLPFL